MSSRLQSCKLTSSQILILKELAKSKKPLTRAELERRTGSSCSPDNLGPSYKENLESYPHSLYAQGYVEAIGILEGDREVITFQPTERGYEAASKYKAVKFKGETIPPIILDPVVIKIRKTRSYSFESYTTKDLQEIRDACGEDYSEVPLNSLRQQIMNRRKIGAYKKIIHPHTVWPEWYIEYRNGDHWQEKERTALGESCCINKEHQKSLWLVHRNTETLGNESREDIITLCLDCWKKLHKVLPAIPKEIPGSNNLDDGVN